MEETIIITQNEIEDEVLNILQLHYYIEHMMTTNGDGQYYNEYTLKTK